jgi:ornithine cyclodeaminase/alanine dehydrogenase-like protein (mu-crystallin family)
MIAILDDADVATRLAATEAVGLMREALLAAHRGELVAPPRTVADLDEGRLLFTSGRWRGWCYGYRAYDTFAHDSDAACDDQLVAIYDDATGRLLGIVVGPELGRRRTGALGGAAVDALAPGAASTLGLVGAGTQAWAQLWAVAAVRRLESVRVYSRDQSRRRDFAERVADELGLEVTPVGSARDAVTDAAIVILATNSADPVVRTDWLAAARHVTTLGPKQRGRSEFAEDLLDAAAVLATDSVAQIGAYDPPALASDEPHSDRIVGLGAILAGDAVGRSDDSDLTVYLSVGLAGTEVALAARLLELNRPYSLPP